MSQELSNLLSKKLDSESINGEIINLEPLTGGASKEIWKFEVKLKDKSEKYILRRGSGIEGPLAIKTSDEAQIQKTVRKLGALVPEIISVSSLSEPLGDSYIMKFVEGETIARKILRDLFGISGLRRYLSYFASAWGPNEKSFYGNLRHFFSNLYGFLICQLAILMALTFFDQSWLYLLLWWVPKLTIFSLFYRLRNIAEHANTSGKDDFSNTRTTLSSKWFKYFIAPLNVNYHLEHHLFMFCPWYNLPRAHQILREKDFYKDLEIENGYLNVFRKVIT